MQIFEYTNKGARKENQDYLLYRAIGEDNHIFILADGMGGYTFGDIAAKSVAESIYEYADAHIKDMAPAEILRQAIPFANEELSLRRFSYGGVKMGAVIVVMLLVGTNAYVTWLGDSRLYQYRKTKLIFQTEDHSMVNDIRKIRFIKPSEYEFYSSVVTRCVMGDDKLGAVEVHTLPVENGDIFYLCSDGIHKVIEPVSLPESDADAKAYLDEQQAQFDDNYSIFRIIAFPLKSNSVL